jgi:pyruvate/2-oxoglutarate dehydrogenase complex dihydrolipoamide dehydrogenase (E3) component
MPSTSVTTGIQDLVLADDIYDRQLVDNCHPSPWINPRPTGRYNLVVLGAGTAGLVSAAGAATLGAKVALVERALLGGDCLNTGCVPSKAVLRASRAIYDARESKAFGVALGASPAIDFAAAMERMRRLRAGISHHDSVHRFKQLGIDVYLGSARFISPTAIEVAGARLEFSRAVIATGARAAALPIPGLEEAGYYTNETIFNLTELPRRMVAIGGGPIGCELAQAFRRFGSQVTLLNDVSQILPREDRDVAELLERQFEREGIRLVLNARIDRAGRRGDEKIILFSHNGQDEEITCDALLLAAGRAPNTEGLGLEAAGVKYSPDGVEVDDRLRTTNSRIYAAGDICSRYKFTHAADAMARTVLANALFYGRRKASALVIPWCTYTDPEIAHVGYYEAEARRAGIRVETITHELKDNDRAKLDGEDNGFARVHYDSKTGRILGGTIVARHAGEMIGELTLALTTRQKLSTLSSTIHPYPTQSEALKKLGDLYVQKRLTPRLQRIFKKWFEWSR